MYMSRIILDSVRMKRAGVYGEHQALWDIFSDRPDRERDFLYRKTDTNTFLTVSNRVPENREFLRSLDIKEYDPKLARGERFHFSLRFNPVVKRRDDNGRQQRIDIVQDRRKALLDDGVPMNELPNRLEIADQVVPNWFDKRGSVLGFELERGFSGDRPELVVESYSQEHFRKESGRKIFLSCMEVRGFATVIDPEKLKEKMFEGVGCAKGFGFGLLLARRA